MYVAEHDHIELDLCAGCRGVWFDADELELLLGTGEALRLEGADVVEDVLACPRCRKTMQKANIGPEQRVVIDVCPDGCGLWFEKGEVSALCRDLEAGGRRLAPTVRDFLGEVFPENPA
jgi:Zn-finger nucleic acid-binding protein